MLVPLSWLREFAPFDLEPVALGEVFDDLGMVVEALRPVGVGLEDVVVVRVLSVEAIPGADKIRRVMVDAGQAAPVQIVCGAWNFGEGDFVPLARVGAVLPGGFEIGQRKMKGVVSDGMLCSARELDLGDDAGGLLVLSPNAASPGTPLIDALGIVRDTVFDLAIEANRPDANCIAGVARDAAARLGLPFSIPEPPAVDRRGSSDFAVSVESPELCDRFVAQVFDGVTVAPSPEWMARRLVLAGMRPISNVVDASNYVMLELGQPTHAYDLDRLPGPGLGARAARPGERLTTLDGVERVLGEGTHPDCLICDCDDVAIGIAGIMGGASSEVHDGTARVALEVAHFVPMAIARTSKRIGLRSEASARFERGVDIEGIDRAAARFAALLVETSPGLRAVGAGVDWRAPGAAPAAPIRVRVRRVNSLLGTDLDTDTVSGLLTPLGFAVAPVEAPADDGVVLHVTPPSFRPDAVAEVDVIEEVARHHGYGKIALTRVAPPQVGRLEPHQRARRLVRDVLAGAGLSEAAGGPLVGPGDHPRSGLDETLIAAVDPLAREESRLRTSLRPGLLRAVAFNHDRRWPDLGFFEIGGTWQAPSDSTQQLPEEREILAVILAGRGPGGSGADGPAAVRVLRRLAAACRIPAMSLSATQAAGLHPTRTATVTVDDQAVGWVGEIDPQVSASWGIEGRVGWLEVDLVRFLAGRRVNEHAAPVSRFPSSDLDLAFVVPDSVPAAAVEATLEGAAGELLERLELFDVYRGGGVPAGSRSLAFRLRFVASDRTLTDGELAAQRADCVRAVESAHGAVLRG